MKVVVLSPYPERLKSAFLSSDEIVAPINGLLGLEIPEADFLVSFGHTRLIPKAVLDRFPGRAINIHTGFLPWNRGADPNFWSWFDDTKKGVTIHHMDEGLDTGEIIFQIEVAKFRNDAMTLKSTYDELMASAVNAFRWSWPSLKTGRYTAIPQRIGAGSYHNKDDKNYWMARLPLGWDTRVQAVQVLGQQHREGPANVPHARNVETPRVLRMADYEGKMRKSKS